MVIEADSTDRRPLSPEAPRIVLPGPRLLLNSGIIKISNGDATAGINPQGGIVRSWKVDGRELLFSHPNPEHRLRASHPIGPACGMVFNPKTRERNGLHVFEGKVVKVPLHGGLREEQWTPVAGSPGNKTVLEYANVPGSPPSEMAKNFPFHYIWNLGVELPTPEKLVWGLSYTGKSEGKEPPVDMGLHLYLPFKLGMKIHGVNGLKFDDYTAWDAPAEGTILSPGAFSDRLNRDWQIRLNSGPDGKPRTEFIIEYPEGYSMAMRLLSPRADTMVVWTHPTLGIGDFICPELWRGERNSWKNGTADHVGFNERVNLKIELEYLKGKTK
jgi:galactose mutarotase-like enzyme